MIKQSKPSSGGGGFGCLSTSLMFVAMMSLIGWAGFEMEPRAAALWALWLLPYFWGGLVALGLLVAMVSGMVAHRDKAGW